MKKLILELEKSEVESDVAQATAYTGVKSASGAEAAEIFGRVATVDGDSCVVERFVRDACAVVAERLKEFVVSVNYAGSVVRLELSLSDAYDESMLPAARSSFRSFLAASATDRWMRLAYAEKAAEWEQEAVRQLAALERNLYHRRRPRRRSACAGVADAE